MSPHDQPPKSVRTNAVGGVADVESNERVRRRARQEGLAVAPSSERERSGAATQVHGQGLAKETAGRDPGVPQLAGPRAAAASQLVLGQAGRIVVCRLRRKQLRWHKKGFH